MAGWSDPILGSVPFRFAPGPGSPFRAQQRRALTTTRVLAGTLFLLVIVLTLMNVLRPAQAQSGGSFAIRRQVIASGGDTSSGGQWQLMGTAGQAVAHRASGENYVLQSGFWHGAVAHGGGDALYADGFE